MLSYELTGVNYTHLNTNTATRAHAKRQFTKARSLQKEK